MTGDDGRRSSSTDRTDLASGHLADGDGQVAPLGSDDPRTIGPYALVGRLGDGGMGSVYLGRSPADQLVAIKVIRGDLAREPEFRARFLREAETARRVARFCTAEVLDVDTTGNRPYLVTEYIEGPTLSSAVRHLGPLQPAELERLAVAVASALTAIHAAGLVHRDLKPGNIILSSSGARVIDFGIARALESTSQLTQTGVGIGTPAFMAPEQALGEQVTAAADIYAWGGVVLYAGTGRMPYGDGSTPVILFRAVNEQPDFTGLDPGLRPLVERAMAKNPDARPTAQQLFLALAGGGTLPADLRNSHNSDDAASDATARVAAPSHPHLTGPSAAHLGPAAPQAPPHPQAPAQPHAPRQASHPRPAPHPLTPPPHHSPRPYQASPPPYQPQPYPVSPRPYPVSPRHPAQSPYSYGPGPGQRGRVRRRRKIRFVLPLLLLVLVALVVVGSLLALHSLADKTSPQALGKPLKGHTDAVYAVAFSLDGRTLATASGDNTVRLWDVSDRANAKPLGAPLTGHTRAVRSLAFSPNGTVLATGSQDTTIRLWNVADPANPQPIGTPLQGHTDQVNTVVFSPDGAALATGSEDATIRLWNVADPANPQPIGALNSYYPVYTLALSPDGSVLAAGSYSAEVQLWQLSNPETPYSLSTYQNGGIYSVAFSPDGSVFATGSEDNTVRLWNLADLANPVAVGSALDASDAAVVEVAFSPDGRTLASGSRDHDVQLWDVTVPTAPERLEPLTGHHDAVLSLAFTLDSSTLATGSEDSTARLWDVRR